MYEFQNINNLNSRCTRRTWQITTDNTMPNFSSITMQRQSQQPTTNLSNGAYLQANGVTVQPNSMIPLSPTLLPNTNYTYGNNGLLLPIGTYLVNFSANANLSDGGGAGDTGATAEQTADNNSISTTLTLNGTPLTGETATQAVTGNETVNISKSAIIAVNMPNSTLGLMNNSTDATTYNNASLSIVKLQ